MLGFLRLNLWSASSETKTNAYITMVRSNLEYCASAWNPWNSRRSSPPNPSNGDFLQLWYLVVALELCRRELVPGSATQAGDVNLLVPMGYHSCVFFPFILTFIYMAYPWPILFSIFPITSLYDILFLRTVIQWSILTELRNTQIQIPGRTWRGTNWPARGREHKMLYLTWYTTACKLCEQIVLIS